MEFIPLYIPDVILVQPHIYGDARGGFWETYRKDLFAYHGIADEFVQDNQSVSTQGVLRGLHWQVAPAEQAKLVQVVEGAVFDVAVDIRPGSPTFGQFVAQELSAENRSMLYIPPGFAHGFLTLSEEARVHYKVSAFYAPEAERGLLWNDPEVAIPWPDLDVQPIVSEKDQKFPALKSLVGVQ